MTAVLGGCLEFIGCRTRAGYGLRRYKGKLVYTHRLAYAEAHGLDVFTMGGVVLHACDNPACMLPAHLSLGTQLENIADCKAKGRQAKGSSIPSSKLTETTAQLIRSLYVPRCKVNGQTALALRFGLNQSAVSRLLTNKNWKQ